LDQENSTFLYNFGVLQNLRHQYGEAVDALQKSIDNNKENVYAYVALGDALEKDGDDEKALNVYRELDSLGVGVKGLREKIVEKEKGIASKAKAEKDAVAA
jgi:tetratricopeptide (TPR) repeat protein